VGWVRVSRVRKRRRRKGVGAEDRGRVAFASLRVVHPGAPAHPLYNRTAILPSARAVVLRLSVLSSFSGFFIRAFFLFSCRCHRPRHHRYHRRRYLYSLERDSGEILRVVQHRIKGVRTVSIRNVCGASLAASYRTMMSVCA